MASNLVRIPGPTQRALAILEAAMARQSYVSVSLLPGRNEWLYDPKALVHVRRKVEAATRAALDVQRRLLALPIPTLRERIIGTVLVDGCASPVAILPRDFSDCYPASTGPDTSTLVRPIPVATCALDASNLAHSFDPSTDIDRAYVIRAHQNATVRA